ncbi:hypothetical protein ES708_28660 [subsurface metagenome]
MTDTKVKINGKSAGEMHQGGFYRFKYDISKLLKYGKTNLLEVDVAKHSSNAYDLKGNKIVETVQAKIEKGITEKFVSGKLEKVQAWNPEWPTLYNMKIIHAW